MTVKEAIERADTLFPNVLPFTLKMQWLRDLDERIFTEFISCYEGHGKEIPEGEYTPATVLLIDEPFTGIYTRYICLQADIMNGDTAGYKNDASLFNSAYLSFMNHFNRTNFIKKRSIRIGGDNK